MEGCQEKYLNNKGRIHATFAKFLDNALDLPDSSLQHHSPSPPLSPCPPPVLDDAIIIPPLANYCVPSFSVNTDLLLNCILRVRNSKSSP